MHVYRLYSYNLHTKVHNSSKEAIVINKKLYKVLQTALIQIKFHLCAIVNMHADLYTHISSYYCGKH